MDQPAPTKRVNRVPLYALYAANIISVSGNVMAFIAIPWFVLQTTGSAGKTGLTAVVTSLPAVIAAFFGGVLIDRIGYRRTSIMADLASGVAIALIPLLYGTVGLEFGLLLVLVFFGNLLDAPGATARTALSPDLAELGGIPLDRATAFNDAVSRVTRLIGAPLAGTLIAIIGASNVLWIDAATFIISAAIIAVFVPRPLKKAATEPSKRYLTELMEGLQFVRKDRLLLALTATVMITNMLDAAVGSVLTPVYIQERFGDPAVLGWISGIFGGTAFLCAVIIGMVGIRGSRRVIFAVAFTVAGLRTFVMALFPSLPVLLLTFATIGLAVGFLNPILSAVELERIPANMRARVFGVMTAGVFLGMPLGGMSGVLLERIGLTPTLVLVGVLYVITTLSLLFNPAVREMDKQPELVEQAAGQVA